MRILVLIKLLLFSITFPAFLSFAQLNNPGNQNFKFQRTIWDVQLSINLSAGTGAEFDGTYFYVTSNSSNLIDKYDILGNLIESFSIPGVTTLGDITFDGTYVYGGNGGRTA